MPHKLKFKPNYSMNILAFVFLLATLYVGYVVYTKKNCPTCECKCTEKEIN